MSTDNKYLNQNIFNKIYDEYTNKITKLCFSYIKDYQKSEDICHDTFVQLIKTNPNVDGESLQAWLYRVAINKCRDYLKSAWFKTIQSNNDSLAENPYYESEFDEKQSYILHLLDRLPVKQKEVLVLYYYDGLSIVEISKVLNISVGTVSSRMARAKKKLADFYRGEMNE